MAKTRAMLRSTTAVPGFYHDADFCLQPPFAQHRLLTLLPGRWQQPSRNLPNFMYYLIIGQKHTKLKPAAQYFVIYAY